MKLASLMVFAGSFVAVSISAANDGPSAPLQVSSFHYDGILGTSLDLKFVTSSPNAAEQAEGMALAEIERLRLVLSSWDSTSEVSQLFTRGALDSPSPELLSVLDQYSRMSEQTGQAYSARVGELTTLWQEAATRGTIPDSTDLARVVREIAKPAWRVVPNSGRVVALTTHRIDLNSLGKGFIIDRVVQAIRDRVPGLRGGLINIGGDIQAWGAAPDGKAWRIAVANPVDHADNAVPLSRLALRGGAVSSSGDYQRGFTINGRQYSHIFDPRTGYPVDHVMGVTVIAPDNATANALATTLSVLAPEDGLRLVGTVSGAEALLVMAGGKTMRTPGFAAHEENTPASPREHSATFTAKLAIDVTPTERNRHAPFVAVWISDTLGNHIRTLVFWGDKPKYQRELSKWWTANRLIPQLVDAVTRATRPAGKYSLDWDGLDQKGATVPAGVYLFWLEAAFEDGAHSAKYVSLKCGPAHAAGTIPPAAAFTGAEISCDPVKP